MVIGDRILKTDAVDHHASHDLVGAQQIDWDVTGAIVEFDMKAKERVSFLELLAREGVIAEHLAFHEAAYLAFQLGAHTLASQMNPSEGERLSRAAQSYAGRFRASNGSRDPWEQVSAQTA